MNLEDLTDEQKKELQELLGDGITIEEWVPYQYDLTYEQMVEKAKRYQEGMIAT